MVRGVKNPLWFPIADRLKKARAARELSFRALGSLCELDGHTIGNIERRAAEPSISTVECIAAALGVSACWLAFGTEGRDPFRSRIPKHERLNAMPRIKGPLPFDRLFLGCAERLRGRREAFGISLRQLAAKSGVSHQLIMNVEKGKQAPRVDSVHRLAVALDVAPCWLAYGIGRKPGKVRRPVEDKAAGAVDRQATEVDVSAEAESHRPSQG